MKSHICNPALRHAFPFLSFIVALALAPVANANDKAFEGEITMKVRDGQREEEIDMSVKGSKMRFEVEEQGQKMTMIVNSEAREMMMIMPAQRSYMVMEIPKAGQTPGQPDPEDAKWEETGETEEILGYTAKKYTFTDGRTENEIWGTDELGSMNALMMDEPGPSGTPGGISPLEKALRDEGIFPLRIIERGPGGQEASRADVTKVNASEMDDSLFEPPADFQRMEMPSF